MVDGPFEGMVDGGPEWAGQPWGGGGARVAPLRIFFIFDPKTNNIQVFLKRDMSQQKKRPLPGNWWKPSSELVFTPKPKIHSRHHHPGIRGD